MALRFASALHLAVVHARSYSKGYRPIWQRHEELTTAIVSPEDLMNAPDTIDWSEKGATSPIKNQGPCGSCWAYSTVEGVESAIFMSRGSLPEALSTQELVSCDKGDDGCRGGDIETAVTYLQQHGLSNDTNFPDVSSKTGDSGLCTWNKMSVVEVKGMQYAIPPCTKSDCAEQDEAALAAALAKYGPISICVNAQGWQNYSEGVYNEECSAELGKVDHCVQLVGYDRTAPEPYWKLRNSWSESWGEGGFIRLPYNKQNSCCVACGPILISAEYVGPSPGPSPAPSCPLQFFESTGCVGDDTYASDVVDSLESCIVLCCGEPQCAAFNFNRKGKCVRSSSAGPKNANTHLTCGVRGATTPAPALSDVQV